MNVAVVSRGFPSEVGGGHTFERELLSALPKVESESHHRFLTYVVGGSAPSANPEAVQIPYNRRSRARRVALQALRDIEDRLNLPRLGWNTWLERSFQKHGIEFVWFVSLYLEDCNQPFICTVWDLAHLEQPWFPEVGNHGEWERRQHYLSRFLPKATRVIVPNSAGAEVLLRNFPIGSHRVIELPFPTPEFALTADVPSDESGVLRRLGVLEPYLFYPAQFWAHKNHVTALETLRRLKLKADPSFQLVFAGSDKGQLQYVQRLARDLGVDRQALFLGFVNNEDLVVLYRRAHALLYLSFFGPENLPPLEAFALGCPVICADVPGIREQLGDAALFAPPNDAELISRHVTSVGEPEVRKRLVESGRRRAEQRSAVDYVRSVVGFLDEFEAIRRCWN